MWDSSRPRLRGPPRPSAGPLVRPSQAVNSSQDRLVTLPLGERPGRSLCGSYSTTGNDQAGSATTATQTDPSTGLSDTSTLASSVTASVTTTGDSVTGSYTTTASETSTQTGTQGQATGVESLTASDSRTDALQATTTGNTLTGSVGTSASDQATTTDSSTQTDDGVSDPSGSTATDNITTTATSNTLTGSYATTSVDIGSGTASQSGTDARGALTDTTTSTWTTTTSDSGNSLQGSDGQSQTTTATATDTRSGGDGDTSYSQTTTDTSTVASQQDSDQYSGVTSQTTTTLDSVTLSESGSYTPSGTSYTISANEGTSTTVTGTQNGYSGSDDQTTQMSTGSTLTESGSNSSGSYTLTETVAGSSSQSQDGNDFTGDYTSAGSSAGTTTQENNGFAAGSTSYTETSVQSVASSEAGNTLTGDYQLASTTTTNTTLTDTGSNAGGSFSVGSSDSGTQSRSESGNHQDGSYSASTGSTDSYSWSQTDSSAGPSYTLTATGSTVATGTAVGNRVSGDYSTTQSGTDNFTLVETGTATGGAYSQTVSGSELFSQAATGNSVQQTVDVSDGGSGTYTTTDTGPGATSGGANGTYGYSMVEAGNWQAGSVTQSLTGQDRYNLLQGFNNVADTTGGSGPGHLDFHPFGAAFVDPPPDEPSGTNLYNPARLDAGLEAMTRHRAFLTGPHNGEHFTKAELELLVKTLKANGDSQALLDAYALEPFAQDQTLFDQLDSAGPGATAPDGKVIDADVDALRSGLKKATAEDVRRFQADRASALSRRILVEQQLAAARQAADEKGGASARGQLQNRITRLEYLLDHFDDYDVAFQKKNRGYFDSEPKVDGVVTSADVQAYQALHPESTAAENVASLFASSDMAGYNNRELRREDIKALKATWEAQRDELDGLLQEADRLEQAAKSLGLQSTWVDPNPIPSPPQKKFERGPGSWAIDATNVMEGAAGVLNPVPHVVNFYEQEKKAVELVLQGEPALAAIEHGKASPLGHGLLGVLGQADKEWADPNQEKKDVVVRIPVRLIPGLAGAVEADMGRDLGGKPLSREEQMQRFGSSATEFGLAVGLAKLSGPGKGPARAAAALEEGATTKVPKPGAVPETVKPAGGARASTEPPGTQPPTGGSGAGNADAAKPGGGTAGGGAQPPAKGPPAPPGGEDSPSGPTGEGPGTPKPGEGITRSDHAKLRSRQGRPVGQVVNDVQRAGPKDVFVQPDDGRFVVRGPNGREHIIESDGEHVTSVNRPDSAHRGRLRDGTIRPATEKEFNKLKDLAK